MKPYPVLLAGLCAVAASLAAAQENPVGPVVELPRFVVTDDRELPQPEAWRYGTIPGFEVLSNASDKATQRLLRDFDVFRQALSYAWPVPNRISQPTSLIICGRGGKFNAFVPAGRASPEVALASLFLKQGTKTAIVIDLGSTTLNVLNVDDSADAATGTDSGLIAVEHDKQLYREYIRYLLSRNEPRLPAWLEEGLSQIIMRMRVQSPRLIEFAKLEDPNTISAAGALIAEANALSDDPDTPQLPGAPAEDRDFSAALHRKALVKLDQFFAIKHGSPEATAVLGNNRWAKQAYAFVHMCLYGERGKYQKPFAAFLQRLAREPVSEPMFKEVFGLTYNQMLGQLRSYIDMTVYEAREFRSKKGGPDLIVPPEPIVLREATQAEIGRIKGEALVIAGHEAAAKRELIAPYIRGERDPELLAALGLFERKAGEEARARRFLEAAQAGRTKRPDALLELARLRYADALAAPEAEGKFSRAQVDAILSPLLVARQEPPPQVALYELMADTWAHSAERPDRTQASPVIEGAILFPTRLKLVYQSSMLAAEIGDVKSAHALADHGIKWGPDATVKQRFQDLKAALPPPPAETEKSTKS